MENSWGKTDAVLVIAVTGLLGVMGAVSSAVPREGIPSLKALIVGFSITPLLAVVMWLSGGNDNFPSYM